ncbi:hypothetical protein BH11PSE11_BH11PSE11_32120 [soil metagenome]
MKLEPIWYEYSPYLYAVAGVVSISNYPSYISIGCGVLLLIASGTILRMRLMYRRNKALEHEREERLKRAAKRALVRSSTIMRIDDDEL